MRYTKDLPVNLQHLHRAQIVGTPPEVAEVVDVMVAGEHSNFFVVAVPGSEDTEYKLVAAYPQQDGSAQLLVLGEIFPESARNELRMPAPAEHFAS